MPNLPTNVLLDQTPADGGPRHPSTESVIRSGIMTALGRPPGLYQVTVAPLWSGHYRVNVLTGTDPTAVRIAHSYFVEAGAGGDILAATPRITRLYA